MHHCDRRAMVRAWGVLLLLCFFGLGTGCARAERAAEAGKTVSPPTTAAPAPDQTPEPPAQGAPGENNPVRANLLKSAGRPVGAQAEAGFELAVPETAFAGEPFVVRLAGEGLEKVTFTWRGRSVTVTPGHNNQQPHMAEAAFSVPLKAKEKQLPLTVQAVWKGKSQTMRADIPVGHRTYPEQRLQVAQKYVSPPKEELERIKRDRQSLNRALSKSSPEKYWDLPLLRPVPGKVTSVYGLRRFFNGEERNPHRGVDFRGAAGDPVKACTAGVVVLAEEQYYSGNMIVLDHGLGVFTMYLHMSGFNAQMGQKVEKGDVIGYIGSTGRSTGPHLHLSLSVQGESVNAAPFIEGMRSE